MDLRSLESAYRSELVGEGYIKFLDTVSSPMREIA
jgi:hypothetical protein